MDFIKKYGKDIKSFSFATCCGAGDEEKDDKLGYGKLFKTIKDIFNERCKNCEAFPIADIVPDEMKEDKEAVMKIKLGPDNFTKDMLCRYEDFISRLK